MKRMTIDEEVALLMQGTDYGDETIAAAMARELGERLLESEKSGRPLRVYCGHGPPPPEHPYPILERAKTQVRFNHEWLLGVSLPDLIRLGSAFTLQQFVQRENFRLRWERGEPVYLHETFYALMQGYDAVAMKADVQVGGSDQLFNIVTAGRKVQEAFGQPPQVGILVGILPGTDGVVRMSKSLGNHIPIFTTPDDMYGKIMSIPDTAMPVYFKLLLLQPKSQIEALEADLRTGKRHPRD